MYIRDEQYILNFSSEVDPPISGVYLLICGNEIVYVGQSIDVFKRLRHHISEGTKQFDRYWIDDCEVGDLNDLEAEYIVAFAPRYNTTIPVNNKWTTYNVLMRDYGGPVYQRLTGGQVTCKNGYYLISEFADLDRRPK